MQRKNVGEGEEGEGGGETEEEKDNEEQEGDEDEEEEGGLAAWLKKVERARVDPSLGEEEEREGQEEQERGGEERREQFVIPTAIKQPVDPSTFGLQYYSDYQKKYRAKKSGGRRDY